MDIKQAIQWLMGWVKAHFVGKDLVAVGGTNGVADRYRLVALDASGDFILGKADATGKTRFRLSDATLNALELGQERTASGYAYVDLIGDTTYTDYGLRLIRRNTGADANSELSHRGTGIMRIRAEDAGSIALETNGVQRLGVSSAGTVFLSGALDVDGATDIHADVDIDRGASTSATTRTLSIGGARNASGSDYAAIDFRNLDNNNASPEDYVGARISSQNDGADEDGNIVLATANAKTLAERVRVESLGHVVLQELADSPTTPASGTEAKIYIKGDKFIIAFNNAGTIRYKYLDLTGTGVTWVHTTVAP